MAIIRNDYYLPGNGYGSAGGNISSGEEPEKKYLRYYRPVIEDTVNKKYRNWQAIDYYDIPLNLKEVNIDLDYSKITADYLKYKVNLVLPEKAPSIYSFLFRNKNLINGKGETYKVEDKRKIILNPADFEINKKYDANYFNNYIKEKYGEEWSIVSKFQVCKCDVPMDVRYFGQGSGVIKDHYVKPNNYVPSDFKKWIQYDKAKNWKVVNEEFQYEFKAYVKELWYHSGNAKVVFSWLSIFLAYPAAINSLVNANYYHTVQINTVEFWIQKNVETNFDDYPASTKLLFENNFILTPSTWKDFSYSLGEIEPFNFSIEPEEKLIIKGLFLPKFIEINDIGIMLPNIKNLTQLHIKHIK